ncbi:hypothetical protein K438DRAFT_1631014, partial [Mycena galopus ATCC 62051]
SIMVAVLFPLVVKADIIAFSGDFCNRTAGANVACNGRCIGFDGTRWRSVQHIRSDVHSYIHSQVVARGSHCAVMFKDRCTGESFNLGPEA